MNRNSDELRNYYSTPGNYTTENYPNRGNGNENFEEFQNEPLNTLAVIADKIFGENKLSISGPGDFKERVILNPDGINAWKIQAEQKMNQYQVQQMLDQ